MDIPDEVREARLHRAAAEYPAMVRYQEVFEKFVDAMLEEEWSMAPSYNGIEVDVKHGKVVISFDRASTGNALSVVPTIPEVLVLYRKLGAVLGL